MTIGAELGKYIFQRCKSKKILMVQWGGLNPSKPLSGYASASPHTTYNSGESSNFEKGAGGGRQFISLRPHLSQMHTTNYMLFIRKKGRLLNKNSEPIVPP